MSVTINGDTGVSKVQDGVVVQADLSGGVAGNGPAFSAYASVAQNITNSTNTKIQFNTEEFDTNSNYDSTTNFRFTPTVAGYYQVNALIGFSPNATGFRFISIFKNGASMKSGVNVTGASTNYTVINASALIYLNGVTDYIEVYGQHNSGSTLTTASGSADSYFQALLVRAA